jgi:two-component system, NarL family, nitrate/nitrite response regulator NarL
LLVHRTSPPGRQRLLIAHEQDVIRAGIAACIRASHRAQVVASASEAGQAMQQARKLQPDVALISNRLRTDSGELLLSAIRREDPDVRLIAIVRVLSLDGVAEALRAGAVGVVDEGAAADQLLESIAAAGQTRSLLTGPTASVLLDQLELRAAVRLTSRQRQVLGLLAASLSAPEIAQRLGIRPATVRLHVRHIVRRLGAGSTAQAVSLAHRLGIVRVD